MKVTKREFGSLQDGTTVYIYTLANENAIEVEIINYGGIVRSLKMPDRNGKIEDVVLGLPTLEGYTQDLYVQEGPFLGALIGRYGNRIAKGKFSLEGKEYNLAINNGPNHLHGGTKGFDKVVWEGQEFQTKEGVGLRLNYTSADMEEGYPGKLDAEVTYTLTAENELKIDYKAVTDKTTIVNLTNHAYFNLSGNVKKDILGHEVMIKAEEFVPVDATSIPTGELQKVAGTPMDFRKPVPVGVPIGSQFQQLEFGHGYDHCWVLGENGVMKLGATVYEPESGRFLEMFTKEPGVQFYTGNWLNGKFIGKENKPYNKRDGLCLETQHFPDSPNHENFPSVLLHPGETYTTSTMYKFTNK